MKMKLMFLALVLVLISLHLSEPQGLQSLKLMLRSHALFVPVTVAMYVSVVADERVLLIVYVRDSDWETNRDAL